MNWSKSTGVGSKAGVGEILSLSIARANWDIPEAPQCRFDGESALDKSAGIRNEVRAADVRFLRSDKSSITTASSSRPDGMPRLRPRPGLLPMSERASGCVDCLGGICYIVYTTMGTNETYIRTFRSPHYHLSVPYTRPAPSSYKDTRLRISVFLVSCIKRTQSAHHRQM